MHLIDLSVNFLGCVPIVGSTIPIGVGAAFGAKLEGRDRSRSIFFGDAAAETGVFHESVNFAARAQLPVLFVCENNLYSVNTPLEPAPAGRTAPSPSSPPATASPPRSTTARAVETVARRDAKRRSPACAQRRGPALLEFMTYRWAEHCGPLGDLHLGLSRARRSSTPGSPAARPSSIARVLERRRRASTKPLEAKLDARDRRPRSTTRVAHAKASPFPARAALAEGVYA